MIDLEAILARDVAFGADCNTSAWQAEFDRRALLAYVDDLLAERALLVTRAENAEAALTEAGEKAFGFRQELHQYKTVIIPSWKREEDGWYKELAEARELLREAIPSVQSHIRKHQRSWEAAMKRGDEFHTRKHCEQMNKDLALEARIDAYLGREP